MRGISRRRSTLSIQTSRRNVEPTWTIEKPVVESRAGVVVSQHALASKAGAEVLAEGGNAVDAAVTTALVMGVIEPWLSGIGGGGFLVNYEASVGRAETLDFSMVTPRRLDPARYPLRGGKAEGLFSWPAVVEDRNLIGYDSICVPGAVEGFGQALERFGTIPWRRALEPAIRYAREGLLVDWYSTLSITTAAAELARFPETAERFMPDGWPPVAPLGREGRRLSLAPLASTLERLSEAGYRDFYEGDVAEAVAADMRDGGSPLDGRDLADYRATAVAPATRNFAGATLHVVPGLSGGPSFLEAMSELEGALREDTEPGESTYTAFAHAIRHAYQSRLATMGWGAEGDSCTTHISVVDRWGNVASLTNTLLARFGSKVTLPRSGVLMNNGLMWFDPVPGRPNSIRAGVRPLANMCPVVVTHGSGYRAALGAAGGRRIMPALVQLTTFLLHFDIPLNAAVKQPRIDASGTEVIADHRLSAGVRGALEKNFRTRTVVDAVYPAQFSVPSIVEWREGVACGAAYAGSPWPGAVSAAPTSE